MGHTTSGTFTVLPGILYIKKNVLSLAGARLQNVPHGDRRRPDLRYWVGLRWLRGRNGTL